MGGLAPLESKEIAGIAVAFSVVAAVLLIVALVFLVRHRSCIAGRSAHSTTNPALSTIWVRKEGSNGAVVRVNGNNNENGGGNGTTNNGFSSTSAATKESFGLYPPQDGHPSLNSNGQAHGIKVSTTKFLKKYIISS